jgi:hypothetical protein
MFSASLNVNCLKEQKITWDFLKKDLKLTQRTPITCDLYKKGTLNSRIIYFMYYFNVQSKFQRKLVYRTKDGRRFPKKRPQNDPKNTYNLCSIKEVDPEILE